jgi:hypothetical protein
MRKGTTALIIQILVPTVDGAVPEGVSGAINPNVAATHVLGIDRNGHLPTGPFPGSR